MWQKCPICNGTGRVPQDGFTSGSYQTCTVCNGYKIISELTGLPSVAVSGFQKMIDPQLDNLQNPKSKMKVIYIASYKEDGQPCCASLTREGLQKSLNKYNGFDEINPNISILERKVHEYKYGGESLIETIVYRDLTFQENYPEDIDTVYYIHCLNLD